MPALSPAEVSTAPSSTKSASGSTVTAGKRAAQLPRPGPVRRRPAAVEQARVGEREGPGADREDAGAAAPGSAAGRRAPARAAAPGSRRSRGRRRCRPAARAPRPASGVIPEATRGAHLGAVDRAGRELVVRLAPRPRRRARRPGRCGQVEGDETVEAEGDDAVHGRNLANIGIPASRHCATTEAEDGGMDIAMLVYDQAGGAPTRSGPTKCSRNVPGWEPALRRQGEGPRPRPRTAPSGSAPTTRSTR